MKQLVIFTFLAVYLLFATGCKKEDKIDSTSIQGLWELRQASGMYTINYAPGNGNTIKFTGNNYEISSNGQISARGQFEIIQDPSAASETCLVIAPGQFTERIIYDHIFAGKKIFMQVSNNSLSFLSGCFAYDAGSSFKYERR